MKIRHGIAGVLACVAIGDDPGRDAATGER
jgi:hypothetical protein